MSIGTTPDPSLLPASPPARRAHRVGWRDPRLIVGILLVVGSVLLGARLLAQADDTVAVWVVKIDLRSRQPVTAADLTVRRVRFADASLADRYLRADSPLPQGLRALRDVGAGELLPRAAVGTEPADRLVQVPLRVDTGAVPGTVTVGSLVDVWVTPDVSGATGGGGGAATLVFDDVPVLAVPRSGDELGPQDTRQVIVGVDPATDLSRGVAELVRGTVLITRDS